MDEINIKIRRTLRNTAHKPCLRTVDEVTSSNVALRNEMKYGKCPVVKIKNKNKKNAGEKPTKIRDAVRRLNRRG